MTLSMLRTGRITGSRISGVLGKSPYHSRDEVMREMVREYFWDDTEFSGNFITDYGKAHEADAIAEYEMTRGVRLHKTGADQEIILHPHLDYLAITPDGLVETGLVDEDGMVETKCPWRAPYTDIRERPDYYLQVMLQLACTGRSWCDFVVWRPDAPLCVSRVHYDPDWLDEYIDELEVFIEEFRAIVADPERYAVYREPLVDVRIDAEWRQAAIYFLDMKAAVEARQRDFAEAKEALINLTAGKTTKGAGVLLIRTNGKAGSVSYAKALKHYAPDADLSAFRGTPGQPGWTARRTSEKGN
jgi:putative phage-type endonuclease